MIIKLTDFEKPILQRLNTMFIIKTLRNYGKQEEEELMQITNMHSINISKRKN